MKKYNFIKDVLLFRKREFILMGSIVWLCLVCMVIDTVWTSILIYQYLNIKP